MTTLGWTILAAPCAALAALSLAPQVAPLPDAGSTRTPVAAAQELADEDGWRARLENQDLRARENDFDELVSRAAKNAEARATLESWAQDETHREFAWTCRLALREARARSTHADPFGGMDDTFEELRQRMFSGQHGADPFGDFFLLDPFAHGGGTFGFAPFPGPSGGGHVQSSSEGFSLEVGPDGVKAHVKQDVGGEVHDEEYTAATVDELLAAHPELASKIHGSGGALRFSFPGLGSGRTLAPRTDRLGVYVPQEPEDGAVGLRIQSVLPGTLAEELGLEPGQVIVSIDGREIRTRDDISSALRERASDATLEVEVRGADGVTATKSWKPDASRSRGIGRPLAPLPLDGTRKL